MADILRRTTKKVILVCNKVDNYDQIYSSHEFYKLVDTQQGVGERRFAHVGAADDGDARQIVLVLRRSFGGQRLQDGVHQVARTASRHRRDAVGVAQPELVELVRGVDLIVVVD